MLNYKPKYKFRFLVRVEKKSGEIKFNKLGPILNQLNVEDAPYIDDILLEYYKYFYRIFLTKKKIFSVLNLIIWKNENLFTYIDLRPHVLEGVLKIILQGKTFFNFNERKTLFNERKKLGYLELFSIVYISQQCWRPDKGFYQKIINMDKVLKTLEGTLFAYSHRQRMLGRKTNFRRKVKKKKFEDYV